MFYHYYLVYNQSRNKDIIKIKSEHSTPCTSRDAEQINQKTIFSPIEVAFIGIVKTEEEELAGPNTPAGETGQQRPK